NCYKPTPTCTIMTKHDKISYSSSSDSESDPEEAPPIETTGENDILTLADEPGDLILPPEDLGEEDEGEGEGGESGTEQPTPSDVELKKIEEEKPKKKKKKKKKWFICTVSCKYESVRRVSKRFGFKEVNEDEDWHLYWTDYSVALERVMDMKKYQKINHFPGMSEICRKDLLARNMNRMIKLFPKEYNVFPKSWILPSDYGDFLAYTRAKKHKTYILKPESGCQGKGIWVTKNPKDIKPHEHMLCQQYLSKPFLIDQFKFDLRVYALVTSCDPLRIFVFKDGLARFATVKYSDPTSHNTDNVYMHLTNYAINKHSTDFVRDDEAGSKRRISTVNKWFKDKGYDVDKIWNDIDDVIIKTLISAHPVLKHNYRTCFPNHVKGSACFEILGFDIMFDKKLKPYLIEVNHSPSFHTDSKLDKEIKEAMLYDTMNLANFGAIDKRRCIEEERRKIKERLFQKNHKKETKEDLDQIQKQFWEAQTKYEDKHMGNYRRAYPSEGYEKYDKYFSHSGSLYQETAAYKARSEAARQQREEILRKKEKLESMLKKKKDVRPESPGTRRRNRVKKTSPSKKPTMKASEGNPWGHPHDLANLEPVNTQKPVDIAEEDELERISALLQRDNLVRGLGIVEHVYRLLHCTPGTMGVANNRQHINLHAKKSSTYIETLTVFGHERPFRRKLANKYYNYIEEQNSHINAERHLIAQAVESKDINIAEREINRINKIGIVQQAAGRNSERQTEKYTPYKELEKLSPKPHSDIQNVQSQSGLRAREMTLVSEAAGNEPGSNQSRPDTGPLLRREQTVGSMNARIDGNEDVDLPLKTSQLNIHDNSQLLQTSTYSNQGLNTALQSYTQPSQRLHMYASQQAPSNQYQQSPTSQYPVQWTSGKSLKSSNYAGSSNAGSSTGQKIKQTNSRKYVNMARGGSTQVLSENEYKQFASAVESELERTRLGRGLEWRTEGSAGSNRVRTLSATSSHRSRDPAIKYSTRLAGQSDSYPQLSVEPSQPPYNLPSVLAKNAVPQPAASLGLSVVSAPAPVVQRPELGSQGNGKSKQKDKEGQQGLDQISGIRPTKAQKIRGASNSIRLKQLELRENHASVLS
ncbi:unnamed protein product, partial [Owenia fusiformis]